MVDRGLNYTVVIGNDLAGSKHRIDSDVRYAVYNHDAFFFGEHIFSLGKDLAWKIYNEKFEDVDNIYFLQTGNSYEYSKSERKAMFFLRKLYNVTMKHQKMFFIKMEVDERQQYTDIPADIKIERSGFMGKTGSSNNIFNAILFVDKQAYLVTIVMKDFVSRHISQPIISVFELMVKSYIEKHGPLKFNFASDEPRIRLPWQDKPVFDSLEKIICTTKDVTTLGDTWEFRKCMTSNPETNDAFSKLEYPNILINFRVLNKDFL